MDDRIYRSLRTAQERELQTHPSPPAPSPAPGQPTVASAGAPAVAESPVVTPLHVAPQVHLAPPAPLAPQPHAAVRPAEPFGLRWLGGAPGTDRPRISVVGTLSLSVLISAGLFASSQLIFKSRQSQKKESVAANSAAMHVGSQLADASDEDASAPVSVPSHFQHVHAPGHSRTHSTHAVAADDQSSPDETPSEENAESRPAPKTHQRAATNHPIHHATDEAEVSLPGDTDGTSQPFDRSAATPVAPVAVPEMAAQVQAAPFVSPAVAQTPAAQTAISAPAQPVAVANQPAIDASAHWPTIRAAGQAQPTGAAAPIATEATSSQPTLTIVPGRPDSVVVPPPAPATRPQATVQQVVQPAPIVQPAPMAQQAHVEPTLPTIQPTAAAIQSAVNPFETLDRTKVMSFQFRNAPWSLVLAKFANATGLELRLQAMPDGTFNRWDSARYTPSQTLAILNSELAKLNCQAKVVGTSLCVVPASGSETATSPVSQASGAR